MKESDKSCKTCKHWDAIKVDCPLGNECKVVEIDGIRQWGKWQAKDFTPSTNIAQAIEIALKKGLSIKFIGHRMFIKGKGFKSSFPFESLPDCAHQIMLTLWEVEG